MTGRPADPCTAAITLHGASFSCELGAGHDEPLWHQALVGGGPDRQCWTDSAQGAVPHQAPGYCPRCGRGDCAPTADEYEQLRQRAEVAEASLALANKRWGYVIGLLHQVVTMVPAGDLRDRVLAALDPEEPRP